MTFLLMWTGTERQLDEFLTEINGIKEDIQFTVAEEGDNQLLRTDNTNQKQRNMLQRIPKPSSTHSHPHTHERRLINAQRLIPLQTQNVSPIKLLLLGLKHTRQKRHT